MSIDMDVRHQYGHVHPHGHGHNQRRIHLLWQANEAEVLLSPAAAKPSLRLPGTQSGVFTGSATIFFFFFFPTGRRWNPSATLSASGHAPSLSQKCASTLVGMRVQMSLCCGKGACPGSRLPCDGSTRAPGSVHQSRANTHRRRQDDDRR